MVYDTLIGSLLCGLLSLMFGMDDRLLFSKSLLRYTFIQFMTIDDISLFFTNNSHSIDIVVSKHMRYDDCEHTLFTSPPDGDDDSLTCTDRAVEYLTSIKAVSLGLSELLK